MNSETYKEMKARHEAEINALPVRYAFSRDQFNEILTAWDITKEEAKNGAIIGIGAGGFIRSGDSNLIAGTFKRIREEEQAAIAGDPDGSGFIYDMFLYELRNHEYIITQDVEETLEALNISNKDLAENEALLNGLNKAIKTIATATD